MKTIVIGILLAQSISFAFAEFDPDVERNSSNSKINEHYIAINATDIGNLAAHISDNKRDIGHIFPPIPKNRTKHLMLRHCTGTHVLHWGACPTYSLGDSGPAGGMVFRVSTDKEHGLELQVIDGEYQWGCDGIYLPNAAHNNIGAGMGNTAVILDAECKSTDGSTTAAEVVSNYSHGGFSDWYLPSKDELYLAYEVLYPKNPKPDRDEHIYWSSSDYQNDQASVVDGIAGETTLDFKDTPNFIVAIRSF